MKNIKKILLIMAMTMALGTSAFAASGFEFILNVPFGINYSIPTKDLGLKGSIGYDIGVDAQLGYMIQVSSGFGISVLADLGYSADWYNYSAGTSVTADSSNPDELGVQATESFIVFNFHSFKLGLLPKFNIGVGSRGALSVGIGGGVKIPIAGKIALPNNAGGDMKRQDIVDFFSPSVIGYVKATLDYSLFFTDNIAMNFGLYLGGDIGPKIKEVKIGGNAFDFGLQLGFRFGPKA
ncbi:PorT family protein [Brachyspira sp.]|uniref:PorT family protein n=1 Tax=Brachyspira sp. TaxID=1977261 RepID=UPI003D7CA8FF